ncbi:hypothetical protein HYX11_02790 [Candidatus Woesearchaeota archaeon]|nr:hypothetical protein [Candidatus Woesearchaeota archaeon]
MSFETILHHIVTQYNQELQNNVKNYRNSIQKLLIQHLQAKQIHFHEHNSETYIVAPGLSMQSNRRGLFHPEFVTYSAKNHRPLPAQENGYCIIHLLHTIPGVPQNHAFPHHHHIEKIALEFHPKLPLPKTGTWNLSQNLYQYESNLGEINAEYCNGGKGHYHQKSNHSSLELYISINRYDIRSIRFTPAILGDNTLTSFFKDIEYEGLDKLVN